MEENRMSKEKLDFYRAFLRASNNDLFEEFQAYKIPEDTKTLEFQALAEEMNRRSEDINFPGFKKDLTKYEIKCIELYKKSKKEKVYPGSPSKYCRDELLNDVYAGNATLRLKKGDRSVPVPIDQITSKKGRIRKDKMFETMYEKGKSFAF